MNNKLSPVVDFRKDNRIEITHIRWSRWGKKKEIGVAKSKVKSGTNLIKITAKDKNGDLVFPHIIAIDGDELKKMNPEDINNGMLGYYIDVNKQLLIKDTE